MGFRYLGESRHLQQVDEDAVLFGIWNKNMAKKIFFLHFY